MLLLDENGWGAHDFVVFWVVVLLVTDVSVKPSSELLWYVDR
jgi:hypothetical protein